VPTSPKHRYTKPPPSADGNGKPPVGPVRHLARLYEMNRADQVVIGTDRYIPAPADDSSSWADLAESNAKVHYLLKQWIPYDMLTGVVGDSKVGKSYFLLSAVVRPIITGCNWFTGQQAADAGNVVWCDTERRAAVNLERAIRWGLPVDRIKTPFQDKYKMFDMQDAEHINRLTDVVCRYEARAVIVDSFRGAHRGDENNSKIDAALKDLASVCEQTHAACIVIHHTKMTRLEGADGGEPTLHCARGSSAFLAAVVCQLVIDIPDPTPNLKEAWRRLQVIGENLGVAPKPVGFRIHDDGLEFGPAPKQVERSKKEATGKDHAEEWLRVRMRPVESYPAAAIIAEAEALGFPHTGTLQRAKKALQVDTIKSGKHHYWRRPTPPGQPSPDNPVRYAYAVTDGTAVKVGKSDQHPKDRLSDLQTGNPRPLLLLAYTTKLTEAQVKERLAGEHLRGEWFKSSAAVLAEIAGWEWCDMVETDRLRQDITGASGDT
jgi:hypothetical protein